MSKDKNKNAILKKDYERVIIPTYAPANFVPKKALGSEVWDQNNKHYNHDKKFF